MNKKEINSHIPLSKDMGNFYLMVGHTAIPTGDLPVMSWLH